MTEKCGDGYRWAPEIGERVKLRLWEDHHKYGIEHVWSWLRVLTREANLASVEILNGSDGTGEIRNVFISDLDGPIGWRERYEISFLIHDRQPVSGMTIERFVDLAKSVGIAVWPSHDLGNPGVVRYTAANSERPDWSTPQRADIVTPEQFVDRIRIVRVERRSDASVPCLCQYCEGKRVREAKAVHIGNTFLVPVPQKVGDVFGCWTCNEGMRRMLYSEASPAERKIMKQWLEEGGWRLEYIRWGDSRWTMDRATTLKDWGREL